MRTTIVLCSFIAVLCISLAAPTPANAQEADAGGLTCGWCSEGNVRFTWPDGSESYCWGCHAFLYGGSACGWEGHDLPNTSCRRCGGTSSCHQDFRDGPCHIPCGPDGDLVAELSDIREALDQGDVRAVASSLVRERTDASLEYTPGAGRINVILACTPDRVDHMIPVLPKVREKLDAELLMRADGFVK